MWHIGRRNKREDEKKSKRNGERKSRSRSKPRTRDLPPAPQYMTLEQAAARGLVAFPQPQAYSNAHLGVPPHSAMQQSYSYNGPFGYAGASGHQTTQYQYPRDDPVNQAVLRSGGRPRAHSGGHHQTTTAHATTGTHHTHRHHHHHSSSNVRNEAHHESRPARTHKHSSSQQVPQIVYSHSQGHLPGSAPHTPTNLGVPSQRVRTHSHGSTPGNGGHMQFQYSKCTGRRKALCIGINYIGAPHALRGCINDAKNVQRFLCRDQGYREEDIVLLTDDARNARQIPTRRNILDAMRWLVANARPHDALFFHYSGHGGQTPDLDGDEIDGMDEVIFPLDFQKKGHILDDDMHDIMVTPLPIGCRLTAVFDSCHSGTALDLPYVYHSNGRIKGSQVTQKARRKKGTPADVISFSGCKDDGTSADTFAEGKAVGAMSHAFVSVIRQHKQQSYRDLMKNIRESMKKNYLQKPQLSSSHPIDTNLRFIC